MKKVLLILALCIVCVTNAVSQQSINVSKVNVSQFPRVFSYVSLPLDDISTYKSKDFQVTENGIDLSSSVELSCHSSNVTPPINLIMMLDNSRSMEENFDSKNIPMKTYLMEATKQFIDGFYFDNGSKIEIITFSSGMRQLVPFTNNKELLKKRVDNLVFGGGTNFNPPFLDENLGAIDRFIQSTHDSIRRVAVLVSDGEPDVQVKAKEIIEKCNKHNISIFIIVLSPNPNFNNRDISSIAYNTGGSLYETRNDNELLTAYNDSFNKSLLKKICKLYWTSFYSCDPNEYFRNVKISLKAIGANSSQRYELPNASYIRNDYYTSKLFFDSPELGETTERILTIAPMKTDVKLNSFEIEPSDKFSVKDWNADLPGVQNFSDIVIQKGKKHRIAVQFTLNEQTPYVNGMLKINADPCDLRIELLGGIPELKIVSPEGGEKFSKCDKVTISWIGRKKDDAVTVDYRKADSPIWNNIRYNYRADTILWTPPSEGNFFFRVIADFAGKLDWAKTFGSVANENITAVKINKRGENIYITGSHRGAFSIDDTEIQYTQNQDAFVLCFNESGKLRWHRVIGGPGDEEINDFCFDADENIVIVGKMNSDSELIDAYISNQLNTKHYFAFAIKLNNIGVNISSFFFDPTETNPNFTSNAKTIEFNNYFKEYKIQCAYSGEYMKGGTLLSDTQKGYFDFTLEDDFASARHIEQLYYLNEKNKYFSFTDHNNNTYYVGTFTNTKIIDGQTHQSNGGTDIFLYKYAPSKEISDVLSRPIEVHPINLSMGVGFLDFGTHKMGESVTQTITLLRNEGEIPLTISNINLSDSSQFSIQNPNTGLSNFDNVVVQPKDSIACSITYTAKEFGKAFCSMTISVDCYNSQRVRIQGEGLCSFSAKPKIDLGNCTVNKNVTKVIEAVISNDEELDFTIYGELSGEDAKFFKLISPKTGTIVPAGKSIPVKLEFSPTEEREYTAHIVYKASSGCQGNNTEITAQGVNGDISISNLDFGSNRLGSIVTKDINGEEATITTTNSEEFPIEIQSITIENEEEFKAKGFELLSRVADMPLSLNANESYSLKFSFSPKSEERVSTNVIVKVNGKSKDYTATLSGEGFLPKLKYAWECPPPVNPGSESIGTFTIDISDSKSDLYIKSIKFKKGDEYSILGSADDLTLSKQTGVHTFQVKLSPKASGMISDELIITSDAIAGNEEMPLVDSVYQVNCEAKGNAYDTKIDFDNTLICGSRDKSVFVENKSHSVAINIADYKLSDIEGVFSVITEFPINIPPNEKKEIIISFSPKAKQKYSGSLTLVTDDAQVLSSELVGSGVAFALSTDKKDIEIAPSDKFQLPLFADFSSILDDSIKEIAIVVKFNPAMIAFDKDSPIQANIPGLRWKQTKLSHGHYRFDSEGEIPLNINDSEKANLEIARMKFYSAFSDNNKDDVSVQYFVNSCEVDSNKLFTLKLKPVCLDSLRRVQFYNSNTKIASIYPNPIHDVLSIDYSLGIEAPVTLELYNELGNVVMTLVDEKQKAGDYTIRQPLGDLSSGVYYLRLKQSDVVKIQKLNVIR